MTTEEIQPKAAKPDTTESLASDRSTPANRARLFTAVLVVLVALAFYNVVIRRAAHTSQRQELLAKLDKIPPDTECIFLGNSLVEAGCDMETFTKAWPAHVPGVKAVNVALGATSPVEHYLILKKVLSKPVNLKYLVYGFFDDQLNSAADGAWSDLVGNRAFSYYFPDAAAGFYAPGSSLKRWQLEFTAAVPMLSERSSLWGKVEKVRQGLEQIGMPPEKFNRFGRVQDFAALEAVDVPSFNRRCSAVVNSRRGFSPAIHAIINLAHQHGAKVILLEMPMPSRHRNVFYSSPAWARLQTYLKTLARQENAAYVAASGWVPDDKDFEDVTHLNEQGARVFSAEFASFLAHMAAADGQIALQSDAPR